MVKQIFGTVSSGVTKSSGLAALFVSCLGFVTWSAMAQDPQPPVTVESKCSVDLTRSGAMKDIVSNALLRGLNRPEPSVAAFLKGAESRYATGQELLKAAAANFNISEAALTAEVEKFRHCNCKHGPLVDGPRAPDADGQPEVQAGRDRAVDVSRFAKDVTLHVVLHELGHALIREFDLPVLGNEETVADAFATYYLTTYLPDRAVDVLKARVTSLMIEAREVPREQWSVRGEHDNDARRAFQIAALAVAADSKKYNAVATGIGMSERDIRKARDYGAEIHRSWRRVLAPLWMPDGVASGEVRVVCDPRSEFVRQLCSDGLAKELVSVIKRFDWHSRVTIRFVEGDGGAGWSRSKRTITVHSEYVHRFVKQGKIAKS